MRFVQCLRHVAGIERRQGTEDGIVGTPLMASAEMPGGINAAPTVGEESLASAADRASPVPTADAINGVPTNIPAGEAYVSVEGPRGELSLYVQSDGGPWPVRVHLRGPSLPHLHLLDELCAGHLLADLFVIYASLDIMVGEADR